MFRGVRRRGGIWTNEETLSVYVRRKHARAELPRDERIPKQLDGLATDVVPIGRPRTHAAVDTDDRFVALYDGSARKSAISAWAAHPYGGMVALGSGHGLLPIQGRVFRSGRWRAGDHAIGILDDRAVAPGSLWFGAVGDDADFAVVRFPELLAPPALRGHSLASAPIAVAPRRLPASGFVQHFASRRGFRVTGRVVAHPIRDRAITLHSDEGIPTTYQDVIAVGHDDYPFSLGGESGSLVFDEQRRAIGFVVGGGKDPSRPTSRISFVLRAFSRLEQSLEDQDLYSRFFTRSQT